jgi:hypothetical protein
MPGIYCARHRSLTPYGRERIFRGESDYPNTDNRSTSIVVDFVFIRIEILIVIVGIRIVVIIFRG